MTETIEDLIEMGQHERAEGIKRARDEIYPQIPDFRAEQINELSEHDKIVLLRMTMESLRGSWNSIRKREAIIHYLCKEIENLPNEYLQAVRYNAYMLNGT